MSYKKGDWVYVERILNSTHWLKASSQRIFRLQGEAPFYGTKGQGNTFGLEGCQLRPATQEEIQNHLIALAKERGFTHKTDIVGLRTTSRATYGENGQYTSNVNFEGVISDNSHSNWYYDFKEDRLVNWGLGLFIIYEKGVWAEIIKDNQMSKKITGYKCIKAYPGVKLGEVYILPVGIIISDSPEFWEPQYEEEFKAGDWVTVTGNDKGLCTEIINKTTIILGIKEDNIVNLLVKGLISIPNSDGGYNINTKWVRKATLEEIEAAQSIKLGKYNVIFKNSKVYIGCPGSESPYTKEEVQSIKRVLQLKYCKNHFIEFGESDTRIEINLEFCNKILQRLDA